ncbi:hypothetical protein L2755_19745 [Shewanella abyssi]|uniref:hypothetical protein n=1 Tax=Shewanella abyssi TaxID=311789 RepID=UPI002010005E|nr:hypothetical protein [Shewanella abyssi]MCL1051840.1 hypothetical protein [Shewanella abyssi]
MNSSNGNKVSNRGNQQHSTSSIKGDHDRQQAMQSLGEMSMPVDPQTMIDNVDTVIANAMQTINDSLQQTSNYIDAARQRLMQQHPGLKQAYVANSPQKEALSPSAAAEATINASNQNVLNELQKDSDEYQSKVLSAHESQQKQAMARQEAISQTAADMQQQLMAQQQAYQQHILAAASNTAASMVEKTEQEQEQESSGANMAQQHQAEDSSSEQESPLTHAHQEK